MFFLQLVALTFCSWINTIQAIDTFLIYVYVLTLWYAIMYMNIVLVLVQICGQTEGLEKVELIFMQ